MTDTKANRPKSASDAVERHIEALILEGALRPGNALMSERDLALRLEVSRPTLRQALKSLEGRGFLVKGARGVEVADIGEKSLRDPLMELLSARSETADHYLEFRDIVESAAAGLAAERANAPERARLRACAQRIAAAHAANDPQAEADADADLHVAIYEASHNLVVLQIMGALSGGLRNDVLQNRAQMFQRPAVRDLLRDQHLAIAEAIITGNARAARQAAHEHLAFIRKAMHEIRAAEAQLGITLRRLDQGGLGAVKR